MTDLDKLTAERDALLVECSRQEDYAINASRDLTIARRIIGDIKSILTGDAGRNRCRNPIETISALVSVETLGGPAAEISQAIKDRDLAIDATPKCEKCESNPAACLGNQKGDSDACYFCSECCGHENISSWCIELRDVPGYVSTVSLNAGLLADRVTYLEAALLKLSVLAAHGNVDGAFAKLSEVIKDTVAGLT